MPIYVLSEEISFPDPRRASGSGILAIGGGLEPERLVLAYRSGIFPWPIENVPLAWFSPDPRMVLFPDDLHVGRSLRSTLRKEPFEITMDRSFEQVVSRCATVPRPGQEGTWITPEMERGYVRLHERGVAHSVEAWQDDELVGGLYGVSLGGMFCGESMFASVSDASKVAFVHLVRQLNLWDFDFIDCQVYTDHLARFGANEIPRDLFLALLAETVERPTRGGPWRFDDGFDALEAPVGRD